MNNNITPDTLIEYLDNELDPDYRLYVESQINADPELQQLVERLKVARQALVQRTPKEALSVVHKQPFRPNLRVAAMVLVLLIIASIILVMWIN